MAAPHIFDGLSAAERSQALVRLARRAFPAGSVVLAEGERGRVMYLVRSGLAEVTVLGADGTPRVINRVGEGELLGEISLLTGQPASATVTAAEDLEAVVIDEAEFLDLSAAYPVLYRNVGAILAHRLARSARLIQRPPVGRVAALPDVGAPPWLAFAVAASVAWHARRPTLLITTVGVPEALAGRQVARPAEGAAPANRPGADIVVADPGAPGALAALIEEGRSHYAHVLVHHGAGAAPAGLNGRRAGLAGPAGWDGDGAPLLILDAVSGRGGTDYPDRLGALAVPAPGPEETAAMGAGLLPGSGAVGRVVGRAARRLAGLSVGVALGAGAERGYAHLGVLEVLERAGLPVDFLAGTSVGAIVGGAYALGYRGDEAAELMDRISVGLFRPTLPVTSLLSNRAMRARFRRFCGDRRIEDLNPPLAVIAADILALREVVMRRGLLWHALLASTALPGVLPPQRLGPYALVDGGIVNPVPANVVGAMGADVVVAVKITKIPLAAACDEEALEGAGPLPWIVQTVKRSIELMCSKINTDTTAVATIPIEPSFPNDGGVPLRHFRIGRRYVANGAEAAEAALPAVRSVLPWVS